MSMTKLKSVVPLFTLLPKLVVFLFCNLSQTTDSTPIPKARGLQLRLIHIDSPDSPMLQPELSNLDRIKRLQDISDSRMRYLANNTTQERLSRYREPDVASEMTKRGSIYYVELGLGKFYDVNNPFHKIYLLFDSGSDFIWTQCEGCRVCFPQNTPLFPGRRSETYQPYQCNQCPGGQCDYDHCTVQQEYEGGTIMKGIFARETLTFSSHFFSDETVNGLSFVCAIETQNFDAASFRNNVVSGILGMSKSRLSLISQLGARAEYQFSYCLQDTSNHGGLYSPMLLSFGEHIRRPSDMDVTSILTVRGREQYYYVKLIDISVDGRKLNIPTKRYFAIKRDGSGGTLFDTGADVSYIVTGPFEFLRDRISAYIREHNADRLRRSSNQNSVNLEACWEPLYDSPIVSLPTITFHFDNDADMLIQPSEVFMTFPNPGGYNPGLYCMYIRRATSDINIIGAFQQINQRVITNLRTSQLSFAVDDCSHSNW